MLIQFVCKNFKSFKDETVFDLSATKGTECPFHVRKQAGEKILPLAMIMGANASGKSNLLEALMRMTDMVLSLLGQKASPLSRPTPFLFDEFYKEEPTMFEVYFSSGEKEYNYGFSFGDDGVEEEWLNCKSKTASASSPIFIREKNDLDIKALSSSERKLIDKLLGEKTLLLSLGINLKMSVFDPALHFFENIRQMNFDDPLISSLFGCVMPKGLSSEETVRKDLIAYISKFDKSIVDIKIENVGNGFDGRYAHQVQTGHRLVGSDKIVYIPLNKESSGTLKMFALYPALKSILSSGGLLIIDELSSKLHPLLVRVLIQMFGNPEINSNNAQMVFTSHDAWLLNSYVLRRDEIYFVDKNSSGASSICALSDFADAKGNAIRNDENLEKNYLLGKYGGIPEMESFDNFKAVA